MIRKVRKILKGYLDIPENVLETIIDLFKKGVSTSVVIFVDDGLEKNSDVKTTCEYFSGLKRLDWFNKKLMQAGVYKSVGVQTKLIKMYWKHVLILKPIKTKTIVTWTH
ncbi:MAG: hypothetical protein M1320_01890 [Patescibacteria group bacterium]|nr:hypothetical protein [Patescibacteria group bacterium]